MVVYDRYGRPVRGARISLNSSEHCNFKCVFCHKEGINIADDNLMTSKEVGRIVKLLNKFGVQYIKLTGGEPMLRPDILDILDEIKNVGIKEISMTTNGTKLVELAKDLKKHGLNRVNISLHSMDRWRYFLITGVDRLEYTLNAIEAAIEASLQPVKLNTVILKGLNEDELSRLIEYSRSLGGAETNTIQLIELLNVNPIFYRVYHVDLKPIEEHIKKIAVEVRHRKLHNRPVYLLDNGVKIEFVEPMFNHAFCMGNDRIRITYDGKFKPCLMRSDNHVDFLHAIRHGASDKELAKLYLKAVLFREPYFKEEVKPDKLIPKTDTCII